MEEFKEYKLDHNTFIGGWYIPHDICDLLIKKFHDNQEHHKVGLLGGCQNPNDETVKRCTEHYLGLHDVPEYLFYLQNVLDLYKIKYKWSNNVYTFNIYENMNIQYYRPGEGFYGWHMENTGHSHGRLRHLVFMTYLNDAIDAGTEFYHQNLKTPCEKGLTIIWPAGWTHTHRGVVNHHSDKYIITGWYSFNDE